MNWNEDILKGIIEEKRKRLYDLNKMIDPHHILLDRVDSIEDVIYLRDEPIDDRYKVIYIVRNNTRITVVKERDYKKRNRERNLSMILD